MSIKCRVQVTNPLGIHARPAMRLCELAQSFDAEILLRNDAGVKAHATSVIALLMLDSAKGGYIEIEASGKQQRQALNAIRALFRAGFDE